MDHPTQTSAHVETNLEYQSKLVLMSSVLLMLTYAFQELKFSDEDLWLPKDEQIHEIIIRILIKKLSTLVEGGLYKNYNETEENASCLRGRIMFNQNIQQNLILKHRLYCRYSELTQDILENQIIKSMLYSLGLQAWLTDETRNALLRLYQGFKFVSVISLDRTSFTKLQFTRLNEHYRSILKICEILFENSSIEINNVGKYESFAFLIDMNRLFEEFIREYLKQSLKCHGYTVEPGSTYLDEKEKIHLMPGHDDTAPQGSPGQAKSQGSPADTLAPEKFTIKCKKNFSIWRLMNYELLSNQYLD